MLFTKHLPDLAVLLTLSSQASAFWRLECNQLSGLGRVDPLVNPGEPAAHAHTIQGGNNFGFDTTPADLLDSSCTSCSVKQDKSVYWTPIMYFQHTDGSMEMVQQAMPFLAYYWLFGDNVKAFPKGFSMIAGDTKQREFPYPRTDGPKPWGGKLGTQESLRAHAVGFNCLNYSPGYTPEQTLTRHFMPNKTFLDSTCKDGLKMELNFPSCWDGKDFTHETQNDHMAYPDQVFTGTCPEGFDHRLVSMLYETKWATNDFADKEGTFVFSNGDPTGFGYHGDFMNGWDQDVLEQAVEQCTNNSGEQTDCPIFDIDQSPSCSFDMPSIIKSEDVKGPMMKLPGGVPIVSSGYADGGSSSGGSGGGYSAGAGSSTPTTSASSASSASPILGGTAPASSGLGGIFAENKVAESPSSSAAPPAAPATTQAPKVEEAAVSSAVESYASTKWVTKGQDVYKVLVVDEVATVTEGEGTAPTEHARHKRAHDRHIRKHVHDSHARRV
ncbi:MAG: hypothetical protein M4579_006293 [Chaenotheca gracillima]|nr:MAG: hypothetical protein M4579_006293 [Chaenotheca gracillima]